jgi:hypothetical protein
VRRFPVTLLSVLGFASGAGTAVARTQGPQAPTGCHRLFWMGEGVRFARRIYAGTRAASRVQRVRMSREIRCQRNGHAHRYVLRSAKRLRHVDRAARAKARREARLHPWSISTASWYQDGGQTASGWHAAYGVADCGSGGGPCYPFGTRIEFCDQGCVVATVDDHGPYVAGRAFDLGASTAQAIGFSGVGQVRWRLA